MNRLYQACLAAVLSLGLAGPVLAMGGDKSEQATPTAKPADPSFAEGRQAIEQANWAGAIAAFTRAVAGDPQNADAYNYLGYANRKLGNYDQAFANYLKALAIDPDHKGAHEYIGEAYLETNNLAKAEEHLKRLDKICLFSCKEYTELKARVAEFKAKRSS
jgi:tetratricopeptide (TPR) repeat protein